jgi:tRNA G18 (ribose-2'-O)-methylase SpoU
MRCDAAQRPVIFFPGSTIGNYAPDEAVELLREVARWAGRDGGLLIGVDCKKSPAILNAAYNDAAGHTAAFNLNLLARMQRDGFLRWIGGWSGDIVGTHLGGAEDFRTAQYRAPTLLVMGSEGPGLSAELSAACTKLVKIPMAGTLDSLNLAVATALVLYQIRSPHLSL